MTWPKGSPARIAKAHPVSFSRPSSPITGKIWKEIPLGPHLLPYEPCRPCFPTLRTAAAGLDQLRIIGLDLQWHFGFEPSVSRERARHTPLLYSIPVTHSSPSTILYPLKVNQTLFPMISSVCYMHDGQFPRPARANRRKVARCCAMMELHRITYPDSFTVW